jgi:hypothetical protein|tara:strand:+ start:50 stop:670 length:621 start_codon:yes stop_codon:yes gene_type:complete
MNLEIKYAEKKDLKFVDFLQKKNARDLSFYPLSILERETNNQRILLALVNNQHAGYLFHGSIESPRDNILKIFQACIEYDLRGKWYGAGLVKTLEDLAKIKNVKSISLRCGSDIEANNFWKMMDYKCIDIQEGGIRRMRDINVWKKNIEAEKQIEMFKTQEKQIEPSTKKRDSSFYRKRKKGKKSNMMLRGKALLQYKKEILEEIE